MGKPVFIVAAAYSGSVEDGEPVVQPLRELAEPLIDLSGPWPWRPAERFRRPLPGRRPSLLEVARPRRADSGGDGRHRRLGGRRPTPLTDIAVWHHGGAMSRVGETETAYAGRDAPSSSPVRRAGPIRRRTTRRSPGDEFWAAMERHSTGGLYLNLPGLGEEGGARQGRLRGELRAAGRSQGRVRPANLFRMNLNITPGGV